ncbi:MAG: MATE family efflux transporter [Planctomycetes bacterium]|nr:MATE family efflux transporter [Planctomycetota bacterium]
MPSPEPRNPRVRANLAEVRALLALGLPIIASQLGQMMMGFVDTLMAGWLSAGDLAAVAVGNNAWMTIMIFGWGLLMSVSPTVAHEYGAGETSTIGRHLRQGLWLSLGVGICGISAAQHALPIFTWLQIDPSIIETSNGFLRAISWGLPASCAYMSLRGFSEGVGKTRPMMVMSLIGLVTNAFGNWVFMYGKFGFARLGAVGCGVASAITMWVMAASLALWIAYDEFYRPYGPFVRWEWPHAGRILHLLKLGCPIGICLLMEGSMFSIVSLLMGRLGRNTIAGHQIAVNVASITFMVPLGLSLALTVRVGHAMGRGRPDDAQRCGFVGASLCAGFMTLAAILIAMFPGLIASIYTNDDEVQRVASILLLMAAVFQIFDGLQVAGSCALRGMKDTRIPMVITILAYWGLGLPLAYVLGITWQGGPRAMWIGLTAGLAAAALFLNLRFYLVTRRAIANSQRGSRQPGDTPAPHYAALPEPTIH